MSGRFILPRRVEFSDTDMAGIVHFTAFFRYMETAEHEMFRSLGLSLVPSNRLPRLGWPRVSCGFDFKSPLRFGDMVEIRIGVALISEKSITYEADVLRDGQLIARGRSTSACCKVGRGNQMRPVPVPAEVIEKLQRYMVSTERQSPGRSGAKIGGRSS